MNGRDIAEVAPHERRVLLGYLANATGRLDRRDPEAEALVDWLTEHRALLAADRGSRDRLEELLEEDPAPERPSNRGAARRRGRKRKGDALAAPTAATWRGLKAWLDGGARAAAEVEPDSTARLLRRLGDALELPRRDVAILDVLLRYETQPLVEDLMDALLERTGRRRWRNFLSLHNRVLPAVLGMTRASFRRRFLSEAPLIQSGLASVDEQHRLSVIERLYRLTAMAPEDFDPRRLLLGPARSSGLDWSDFEHLGDDRDHLADIVRGALEQRRRGVNVLLHGPPGTGKTAFCQTLAHRLGVELFSVGETDDEGDEPTRRQRLAELRLAQRLLADDRNAIVLFDEMDDLLPDSGFGFRRRSGRRAGRGAGSKVFLNRLLEEAPVPTLWITNEARSFDPAVLRRMMFAIELRLPPAPVRARVWSRQLAAAGIEATDDDALALAREFDAPPGVAAGATEAASLAGGGIGAARRSVRGLSRVLGCERPRRREGPAFDPALIEADLDLAALVDRLAASGEIRFSLCLTGPSGTGKSAWVRFLAERLGLETRHERASDLLSMWVGGSEKNIARAFARARDEKAFLVFDEADSLLADRRRAIRRWEVSQVNEMLTWMESHPLPFACTTNHGDNLDPATLRRFVFKASLGYLGPESVAAAFRLFFELAPPRELLSLRALTPGDFSVVRRKAETLGQTDDPAALLAMLEAECLAKPGVGGAIGFGA